LTQDRRLGWGKPRIGVVSASVVIDLHHQPNSNYQKEAGLLKAMIEKQTITTFGFSLQKQQVPDTLKPLTATSTYCPNINCNTKNSIRIAQRR
jgi:hypothetical protein